MAFGFDPVPDPRAVRFEEIASQTTIQDETFLVVVSNAFARAAVIDPIVALLINKSQVSEAPILPNVMAMEITIARREVDLKHAEDDWE